MTTPSNSTPKIHPDSAWIDLSQKISEILEHRDTPDDLRDLLWSLQPSLSRKHTELIRHSEIDEDELLRLLTNDLPAVSGYTDATGHIQYMSPNSLEILGYAPEALISRPIEDLYSLIHPEDILSTHNIYDPIITATANPEKLIFRMRHGDGHYIYVETYLKVVRDSEGKLQNIAFVSQDISERKQAEEELRESEERYRLLVGRSLAVIYTTTPDGQILDCNQALVNLLGYDSRDELMKERATLFYFEQADRDAFIARLKEQGTLTNIETRIQRRDGTAIWLLQEATLVERYDGSSVIQGIAIDITTQKQAVAALHEAHQQLEATLNALPDLMFILDREGHFLGYRVPNVEALYLSPDQFLGKTVKEVMPESIADMMMRSIEIAAQEGLHTGEEYELEVAAGKRWYELTMSALGSLDSPEGRFVALVRDITQHKDLQTALRLSNERFERAMQASGTGIWEFDVEKQRMMVDARLKAIMGYADDELPDSNDNWSDFAHPEDKVRVMMALEAYVNGSRPGYEVEYRLQHKAGYYRWILVRGVALRHPDGRAYRILGTATDITERKQAELALQEREAHVYAVLNAVPDSMFLINRNGMILDANPRQLLPFIVPQDGMVGRHIRDVFPPDITTKMLSCVDQALKTNKTQICEHEFVHNDHYVAREARVVATNDTQILIIIRDITDRKDAARHQLEVEQIQVLKKFMDHTSHDLRTPITTLMTSTHLLRRYTNVIRENSAELENALNTDSGIDTSATLKNINETLAKITDRTTNLEESAIRLKQLLESMGDMFRLDTEPSYNFMIEDLCQLVGEAVDLLQHQAVAKGVLMEFEPVTHPVRVPVDDLEFSRVMKHLIDNAIRYTPPDGKIQVRVYAEDGHAVFEVQDTGIGISGDHLPFVFDRFYRVDKTRSTTTGGVGLGLTIARKIVNAHQGRIEVRSSPGQGSTFRVYLPERPQKVSV